MSGQSSAAFEQSQAFDVADTDSLNFAQESEGNIEADPIASFLEKHGSTLVPNHEGQMVTVAEAMANCPPFARLVGAMGEGALALTATQKPEEEGEEEKAETEEETEEKTPEAEKSKETEKKSDNKPKELMVSKKEAVQAEQPSVQESAKREAVASSTNLSNEAGLLVADSKASEDTSPKGVSPTASADKASSAERVRGASGAANAPAEKQFGGSTAPTLKSETEVPKPKVEANIPEPAAIQAPEAYTIPQWEVESATRQAQLDNESIPDARLATLHEDNLDDEISSDAKIAFEAPQAEAEVYMSREPGTIASETDAELEKPYLGDMGLTENYPFDELRQIPEEMPVSYMRGIDAAEDLALPIGEAEYSILPLENESAVITPEISVPVNKVEQTILLLAERIEEFEAEEVEAVHQLLDEIINKVEEARASMEDDVENPEDTSEAEELEEELKGLFIQLFDHVGIEYDPELLESCVKLALEKGIPESISTIEEENDINTPKDEGTHEIIKQLLASIQKLKKAVVHAYHLGESALRLYSQKLQLDLERYPAYGDSRLLGNII